MRTSKAGALLSCTNLEESANEALGKLPKTGTETFLWVSSQPPPATEWLQWRTTWVSIEQFQLLVSTYALPVMFRRPSTVPGQGRGSGKCPVKLNQQEIISPSVGWQQKPCWVPRRPLSCISGCWWPLSFDCCPSSELFICFARQFCGLAWLYTESGTYDYIRPVKHEIMVCWLITMCKGAQETEGDITVQKASNMNLINHESKSLIILFTMSQCKKVCVSYAQCFWDFFYVFIFGGYFFPCQSTPFWKL
jgi:hypothetical protein